MTVYRSALRRRSLGILALLTILSLVGCAAPSANPLFTVTGEEEFLPQVRALFQIVGNALRPTPRTAPLVPVEHAGVYPFGINVFLAQEVELEKRVRIVQTVSEAGFHWLRQGFPWEDIEIHGRGDFEDRRHDPVRSAWEKYDHIVDLAEEYEMDLIALLSNPPAWSRADGDARGAAAPPDDLEDFGDYVSTVVSRYRGRIRYYQIWNEPNIYPEWGEQPVDPEAYTELLCLAYDRVKAADPDAVVISAALAQTQQLDPRNMSDLVFLQRMYDAGAGDCFDILAVNVYMLWSGPTDHRLRPFTFVDYARPVYLRDIMVTNGDAEKPIWFAEMNSNAVPNEPGIEGIGSYGQVTLEQQARYAPLAYQRALEDWPWVGVVNFWFFKRPGVAEQNQAWYYFRMMEPDFTPMPVYDAMRDYMASLEPTLYRGVHQEDHWAISYQGAWDEVEDPAAVLGAYRRAETGSTISFLFEGSRLVLTPGPGTGEIELSIDGRRARTLALEGEPVTLFSGWIGDRHQVTITARSGVVGVDALTVREPNWGRRLLIGLAGLLIVAAAAYALHRQQQAGGLGRSRD